MKRFLNIGVLLVSLGAMATQAPVAYQYWFDGDMTSPITGPVSSGSFRFEADAGALAPGGHTLQYRLLDGAGHWGTLSFSPFFIPMGKMPSAENKVCYQYWLDNNTSESTIGAFTEGSTQFDIDLSNIAEGGHTLSYRIMGDNNAWGSKMTKPFYVPVSKDASSDKYVAYRVLVNNDVTKTGAIEANTTKLDLTQEIPQNVMLNMVSKRTFKSVAGSGKVTMEAEGQFSYAVQLLSDVGEWGAPLYNDLTHTVTSSITPDTVTVPGDCRFNKVDNNHFHALFFKNENRHEIYFKPSQDCKMELYGFYNGELSSRNSFELKKDETYRNDYFYGNDDYVAVIYDTPIDDRNQDSDIFLKMMFADNKVPTPVINFDDKTWTVSISCDDKRATIHYTTDGSEVTAQSDVYTNSFSISKPTFVRAYAVYEGLGDSEVATNQITKLNVPMPELVYAGNNLFTFVTPIAGVTTYYTLNGESPKREDMRITFDGNPFPLTENSTYVMAYSVMEDYGESEVYSDWIYRSNYITQEPYFNTNSYDGGYFVTIGTNEGDTYYRVFTGKDASVAGDWLKYDSEERERITVTGNMTIQAYSETEGKSRSNIAEHFTDWVRAERPTADYTNFRLKLSTTTPGGKIFYYTDYDYETAKEWPAEAITDGMDMNDIWRLVAYVEAEGYSRSEEVEFYPSNYNLGQPSITYSDGYVDIKHDDENVTIVATIIPEQTYEAVSSNHIRFQPLYGTTVKARATRAGYNDSSEAMMGPVDKPTINVDGYNVSIHSNWNYGNNVFYTTDGSMPTQESNVYDGDFISAAGEIRAAVFVDGYIPNEAEPVRVMDQAAAPVIDYDNGFAKLSTATEGATIYYSIDVSINNSTRKKYDAAANPNGIDMTSSERIYAYAESDNHRRSETSEYFKSNYTLKAPTASYSNGYVTATHSDADVTIKFTDGNGNALTADAENPRRVKASYNTKVNAYATKKGYVESTAATVEATDVPTLTADLFTVSISSAYGQTVYYTTDGSTPTTSSTRYSQAFKVTESCKVRAVAFANGMIPSEGTSLDITYRRTERPSASSYDGRYLTLAAQQEASMVYAFNESDLDANGISMAGNSIDVEGLNKVYVKARSDNADDSEVYTYDVKYYANDTDAYAAEPGHMKDAFAWCDDMSLFESLTVHGKLNRGTLEDSGDYAFLRTLPELRHLDLTNVSDTIVPDSAFVSEKLLSVVMPQNLKRVGTTLFGDDNKTLCALELPGDGFLPDTLLNGVNNPNFLLYARSSQQASQLTEGNGIVKNVVLPNNGQLRASDVTLVHGEAFHALKEFTAQRISFTRAFAKETPIGEYGYGWETLVVPFGVQSITHMGNELKPFAVADLNSGERPFWLFEGADTDWMEASTIDANVPYLISFPNNPLYADEYNVRGDVVFSATNAPVAQTPLESGMLSGFGTGKAIVGTYGRIDSEEDVLAINNVAVNYHNVDFLPGGIFIAKERDVVPFECYVSTDNGAMGMPIFDASGVDQIMGEHGTKIWSEGHDIYIRSSIGMKVRIFDTVGRLLREVNVKAGETKCVEDFNAGLYIVGDTKIYVKG